MFLLSYFKKYLKKSEDNEKNRVPAVIFLCVLAVCAVTLWGVYRVNSVPSKVSCESLGEYSLLASTEAEREEFFSQFDITAESISHSLVQIPSQGKTFEEYNALQETQGLDLRPFMGKQAHQYILRIKRQSNEVPLYAVMTVYKDRVVALHITDFALGSACISLSEL